MPPLAVYNRWFIQTSKFVVKASSLAFDCAFEMHEIQKAFYIRRLRRYLDGSNRMNILEDKIFVLYK